MITGIKRKLDNEPENEADKLIHTPHRETKLELVRSRDQENTPALMTLNHTRKWPCFTEDTYKKDIKKRAVGILEERLMKTMKTENDKEIKVVKQELRYTPLTVQHEIEYVNTVTSQKFKLIYKSESENDKEHLL